ncbi:hypothetical protein HDF16_002641 [Granulicella aggregans]|uniref:Uncharacterized protein n=1 Tax=Granulicella aggregans TaxID=474949 RepID=A0A7W8E580_9BACT|nr:hypothetical protein [Granulicella aggregans]
MHALHLRMDHGLNRSTYASQKYFEVKVISLTRLYLAFTSIRYTWAGFEASQSGAPDKTPLPIKYDGAKHNYKDKQCT